MQNDSLQLNIAYLYPDILQGFCDEANINAFCKRAKARNIEVIVHNIVQHFKIQPSKYDFFYIGGSNTSYLDIALKSLTENKEELQKALNSNIPILAVNCGCYLLSKYYQLRNSKKTQALGLFDISAEISKQHLFSSIIGICKFLDKKIIVGFENSEVEIISNKNTIPFLTLKKGKGNNSQSKIEGAVYKNSIATNLTSPLLAQNPHLCDFLIETALKVKYKSKIPLAALDDEIEFYAYDYFLN